MIGIAADVALLATGWMHVILAPYSKVEESFNLHAVHDVLMYGVGPQALPHYDHVVFPGAVPRTFVGSVMLAWPTTLLASLGMFLGLVRSKFDLQLSLRLILASLNAFGLILMRRAVSHRFGRQTSWLYALLTCSQFHLPFWMGRTLPNMFALLPVNLAYYSLYNRAPKSTRASQKNIDVAIALLVFTAVVFRSEIALLLAPLALQLLVARHTSFFHLVKVGLLAGLTSIALTLAVDSYFWDQRPLWPELHSIYFNVYLGKSTEWGTSPAHAYFSMLLPKLLLGAVPLAALGAALDHRIRSLMIAPLGFILALSALGHKEWRFVIYVVPLVNVAAARGARWMVSRRKGFLLKHLAFLGALSLFALNFSITVLSAKASVENYPGGVALATFNDRYAGQENIHVHISNLAAQTGASLFLHEHAPHPFSPFVVAHGTWIYNKTESLTRSMIASSAFTHLIAESPSDDEDEDEEWTVVQSISAFSRWRVNEDILRALKSGRVWEVLVIVCTRRRARVLEMEVEDRLWILERRGK
ncbi:glycosyltransferase family 22 protein [Phlebopus sp. FC_14]|nr:glycosyltransferase family 22 protein [Phlebopus sp. FC_14]